MKKMILSLAVLFSIMSDSAAQPKAVRGKSFGIAFIYNDFVTPQRIRTTSLSSVMTNDKWAEFSDMNPGVAISFFKGLSRYLDFAATINGTSANVPLPGRSFTDKALLVEADASVQLKLLPDTYKGNFYITTGVGASQYRSIYGAFIPVGAGLKANVSGDTQVFLQAQYRIPVTTESNNYHFQFALGVSGLFGSMLK